jgi:hypothetical protein
MTNASLHALLLLLVRDGFRLSPSDGNFVSTSTIPNVSPSETFRSFLGVDAAVRVEYRDFGSKSSLSGVVFKHKVMSYKFATTIRCAVVTFPSFCRRAVILLVSTAAVPSNTKPVPIHVVLVDVLPASQSARIVVNVVEPPQSLIDEGSGSEAASRGSGVFEDFGVGEVKAGEVRVRSSLKSCLSSSKFV